MSQYLRIVNPTECPIEGFTVLGVSTSRDEESLIGEFGSGNKHAVNVCLRQGINPTIWCGTKRIQFHTQPETMGDKVFNRVYYKIGKRNPVASSIAAEYGEKDWPSVDMAMREFVSNAIDAAGGTTKGVIIDVVEEDKLTPRVGKTIVGIPLTPDIQLWYQQLPNYFLHFAHDATKKLQQTVIPKEKPSRCNTYRKGVLVRSALSEEPPSLFNYNLGEELSIDESRNMSDSAVRDNVAKVVGRSGEALVAIFRAINTTETYWEMKLPDWELTREAINNKELWQRAWRMVNGRAIVCQGFDTMSQMAMDKGHAVVCVPQTQWYNAVRAAGIKGVVEVLDSINEHGEKEVEPDDDDQKIMDKVWSWLFLVDLTNGKEKPTLMMYERIMDGGTIRMGYYKNDVVHIHIDHRRNPQVYMEEMAHHVTGSYDGSRDMQDFAFKGWTKTCDGFGI